MEQGKIGKNMWIFESNRVRAGKHYWDSPQGLQKIISYWKPADVSLPTSYYFGKTVFNWFYGRDRKPF